MLSVLMVRWRQCYHGEEVEVVSGRWSVRGKWDIGLMGLMGRMLLGCSPFTFPA